MTAWLILFWTTLALELYAHVIYPVVMALCGMKPGKSATSSVFPSVSLIIPAHNEEAVIRAKIENTLRLEYPQDCLEILIASDGSTDETINIAREFESDRVRILEFEVRRGKASIVNDAVSASTGNILCLCDANVMFRVDALKQLVGRLNEPHVGVVTGTVRIDSEQSDFGAGESLYALLDRAVQLGESRIGSVMGVDGGMYVIRRELFQPLAPDTILDDFTIAMRAIGQGTRVVYEPSAAATENGTPSAKQEFRRRVRIAAGAVQCLRRGCIPRLSQPVALWQFVSHKLLRWIGPGLLTLLLVASVVLWDSGMTFRIAGILQVIGYSVAAAATFIPFLRSYRPISIVFYFVLSHAAIVVGSVKGLLNKQSAAWARADRAPMNSMATRP